MAAAAASRVRVINYEAILTNALVYLKDEQELLKGKTELLSDKKAQLDTLILQIAPALRGTIDRENFEDFAKAILTYAESHRISFGFSAKPDSFNRLALEKYNFEKTTLQDWLLKARDKEFVGAARLSFDLEDLVATLKAGGGTPLTAGGHTPSDMPAPHTAILRAASAKYLTGATSATDDGATDKAEAGI